MKNNLYILLLVFILFFNKNTFSQEINIKADIIKIDIVNQITRFTGDVNAEDKYQNKFKSNSATYEKNTNIFKTFDKTEIITEAGYKIYSSDVTLDINKKLIFSNNQSDIIDKDGNIINVPMFEYFATKNLFFSKGSIQIKDTSNNNYNFSEIYIDDEWVSSSSRARARYPIRLTV